MTKIAEALDMRFVYGFVPNDTLENQVDRQAGKIAREHLTHTMRLEEQQLTPEETEKALRDLVQKILIEAPRDFWA